MKDPKILAKHFNMSLDDVWEEFIRINQGHGGGPNTIVKCVSLFVPSDTEYSPGSPSVCIKNCTNWCLSPCISIPIPFPLPLPHPQSQSQSEPHPSSTHRFPSPFESMYIKVFTNFEITVACGLKFHWYLRTKIEVFLSLPCWLSQLNWDRQ